MTDALEAAAEFGYDVEKINASATGNEILWDSANNVFCYFNDGAIEYIPESSLTVTDVDDYQYWVITDTVPTEQKYSIYYTGTETTIPTLTVGFDVGTTVGITALEYNRASATEGRTVAIRMNGGTLTINAPKDTVKKFGEAEVVTVEAVDTTECYHEFGTTQFTQIKAGKYILESTGFTNAVVHADTVEVVLRAPEQAKIDVIKESELGDNSIEDIKNAAVLFAGGRGTADAPYLIATAEQLSNIGKNYDEGYFYYKVADGVETIDMLGYGKISLNGSFDGNGVKLVNLNTALFERVGYKNNADKVKISNVEAVLNNTDGRAFVRSINTSGKMTFENVTLHGYIEGQYNMGSFYNYGTANLGGSDGADYTVEFINSTSDMTLVCTSGNAMGGLFGHGYEGEDYTLTVIKDDASKYTGTMYTTGTATCYQIMAMCSHATFILNGVETSRYDGTYSSTKIAESTIVKGAEDGKYTVATATGATSAKIFINAQYDSYDADGKKIQNSSGITAVISTTELKDLGATINALDKVDSVEFVNEYLDGAMAYTLENGVLKVFVGPRNVLSGRVFLQVTQYNGNGAILAAANTVVGVVEEPAAE